MAKTRSLFGGVVVCLCMILFFQVIGFTEERVKEQKRVELVNKRTPYSKEYRNEDGSITQHVATYPIHYADDKGNWEEIDTNIEVASASEVDEDGEPFLFKSVKNNFKAYFPRNSKGWVTLQLDKKTGLGFKLVTKKENLSYRKDQNKAFVTDVLENCDINYTVKKGELKEEIILKQPIKIKTFEYMIRLRDLTIKKMADGGFEFLNKEGKRSLLMSKFVMFDMNGKSSEDINVQLQKQGKNYRLLITPDEKWLNAPERKYPLVIDPSFKIVMDCKYRWGDYNLFYAYIPSSNVTSEVYTDIQGEYFPIRGINHYSHLEPKNYKIKVFYRVHVDDSSFGFILNSKPFFRVSVVDPSNPAATYPPTSTQRGTILVGHQFHNDTITGNFVIPENMGALVEMVTGQQVGIFYKIGFHCWYELTYYYDQASPNTPGKPWVNDGGDGKVYTNGDKIYTSYNPIPLVWNAVSDNGTPAPASVYGILSDGFVYGPSEPVSYIVYDSGAQKTITTKTTYSLSLATEGSHLISLKAYDFEGKESAMGASQDIVVDRTGPTGNIVVNNGDSFTKNRTVTINLSNVNDNSGGSGVKQVRFTEDKVTFSDWIPCNSGISTKSYTIDSPGDGSKTIYAQFEDNVGNRTLLANLPSDSITLDTTPPTGSISVKVVDEPYIKTKNNKIYTKQTGVKVIPSATDATSGMGSMRFRNEGSSFGVYSVYSNSAQNFMLSSGDGEKVIHAQYKDNAGNETNDGTNPIIATVTLDTQAPTGSILINNGALYTNTTSVTLNLSAIDSGIGVSGMYVCNEGVANPNGWESVPPGGTKSWELDGTGNDGTRKVCIKYKDDFGHESVYFNDDIILDRTDPYGSFDIKSRDGSKTFSTTNPSNTLLVKIANISALDNRGAAGSNSGVKGIYFWNGTGTTHPSNATYIPINSLPNTRDMDWTLAENPVGERIDTERTISMELVDNAGNSFVTSQTITIDTTPPAAPELNSLSLTYQVNPINGHKEMVFKWSIPQAGNMDLANFYVENSSGTDIEIGRTLVDGKYYGSYTKDVEILGYNQSVAIKVYSMDSAGNKSTSSTEFTGYTLAKLGTLNFLGVTYNTAAARHELRWQLNYTSGQSEYHRLEYGVMNSGVFAKQGELIPDNAIFMHDSLPGGIKLLPHGVYHYRLAAYNKNNPGTGTYGEPFSITVPNLNPTQPVPTYPTGFARNGFEFQYENAPNLDDDGDTVSYHVFLGEGENPLSFTEVPKIIDPSVPECGVLLTHGAKYTWYVEARDGLGGVSLSERAQFTVDTNAPTVTVEEPRRPYTNQERLAVAIADDLSGLAQNQVAYKKININTGIETSGIITLTPGVLTGTIPLDEGAYHLTITAKDQAGNETSTTKANIYTDRTAPQLSSSEINLSLKNGRHVAGTGRIPLRFTASDNYSGVGNLCYRVVTTPGASLEEGTNVPLSPGLNEYSYTIDLAGENGHIYYLVMAVDDRAGNRSGMVTLGPVLLDKTPPEVAMTLSGLKTYGSMYYLDNLANLEAEAVANDNESQIETIEYNIINTSSGAPITGWAGWETVKNTVLTPGFKYRIKARAINGVGLETEKLSEEFIFDNTKPANLFLNGPASRLASGVQADFTAGAEEAESAITEYRLAIGSTQGGSELTAKVPGNIDGWLVLKSASTPAHFRFVLPETGDGTYYPRLMVLNATGLSNTVNGDAITVNNRQDCVVVCDQGPYTAFANTLTGWWNYLGTNPVTGYRYRIISGANGITGWQSTTETQVTVTGLGLNNGETYKFEVQAIFNGTEYSESGFSAGVTVDTTRPVITQFITPEYTTSNNLKFTWAGADEESHLKRIQAAIGTDYYRTDITGGWVDINGSPVVLSCDGNGAPLNLKTGVRYYLTLRLTNGAGETTEEAAPAILIDDTPPPKPVVTDQGAFINPDLQPLTANWIWTPTDPESGTVNYQWALLEDGQDIRAAVWNDPGGAMEASINDVALLQSLIQPKTYYFAVKATNGAGLTSVGLSDGIMIDRSAPVIPNITLFQSTGPDVQNEVQYITNTNNLSLWIDTYDADSGITSYKYTYGIQENIVDAACEYESETEVIHLENPEITENQTVIFKGIAYNGTNQASQPGYSAGVILDTGAPKIVNVRSGISGNQFYFDWDVQVSYSPVAYYEVSLVGSEQVNSDPDTWTWTKIGLGRHYSVNSNNLSDGSYYLFIKGYNQAGTSSRRGNGIDEWGMSPVVTVDSTPPTIVSEGFSYPRYASKTLEFYVQGTDALSGVGGYQYALGTATDLFQFTGDWIDIDNQTGIISATASTAAIPHNTGIYLTVRVKDRAGLWSTPEISDRILIDHTIPDTPVITTGAYTTSKSAISGIVFNSNDAESGVTHYCIGAIAQGSSEWIGIKTEPVGEFDGSLNGLNLTEGGVYRVAVKTKNGAGEWSEIGMSGPITVDTIAPVLDFEKGGSTIVINTPPVGINYTISNEPEPVTVTFTFAGENPSGLEQEAQPGVNTFIFDKEIRQTYRLTAIPRDKAGNIGIEKTQEIRVNKPPIITLPGLINTTPGKLLTLNATVIDEDGEPGDSLTYCWDTGDGGEDLVGVSPEYQYDALGDYTLTLTVTDKDGGVAIASTTVKVGNTSGGTLYADEVWSGVHHIYEDVIVPAGITLTILPGTQVIADCLPGITGYNNALIIKGSLNIQGGASGVTFSSANNSVSQGWKGIYIEGSATIDKLTIKHAERGLAIIAPAVVNVTNSAFRDNYVGIHVYGGARPTISNCTFLNNVWYGIKEDENGKPAVTGCYFSGNHIDYYYEPLTEISMEQLNEIPGNSGNYK